MEKRDFKGVWIPKEIWLNKDLTPLEKIYLVEIDSLDDGEFGCYASNKHFENMFGQAGPNISRTIKKLEEKGWIKISYEFKGKEVEKRIIKVQRPPYPDRYYKNDNRCYQNDNGVLSKSSEGYYQNDKDRITISDKQLDNNISSKKFKKPTLEDVRKYCNERNNSVDPERFIDFYESKGWKVGKVPMRDWKASIRTWEKNKSSKTSYEEKRIKEWQEAGEKFLRGE